MSLRSFTSAVFVGRETLREQRTEQVGAEEAASVLCALLQAAFALKKRGGDSTCEWSWHVSNGADVKMASASTVTADNTDHERVCVKGLTLKVAQDF